MADSDMTDADRAYAAAQKLIADALAEGETELSFDRAETRALEVLPPEIARIDKLETLDLRKTQVSDLGALSGLSGLQNLNLTRTQVSDLIPLSGLRRLRRLHLTNTQASDLVPLSGLSNLKVLFLNNTPVSDLVPLSGLSGLQLLFLDHTQVSDLTPLSGLSGLQRLTLNRTKVRDLSVLSGLGALQRLDVEGTQVHDLRHLDGCKSLQRLNLRDTQVADLRPLLNHSEILNAKARNPLVFSGCRATQIDPRIAELAALDPGRSNDRVRALFDYLKTWVPPEDAADLPDQVSEGFEHAVVDGKLALSGDATSEDEQAQELYDLIRKDLDALMGACPGGPNSPYVGFRSLLERYDQALGSSFEAMRPPGFWNAGNKLRIELKVDAGRSDIAIDGPPKLSEELQTSLDALVALHNVFVNAHGPLAALDANLPDPVDRPKAAEARDQMGALIDALAPQVRLVLEEVIEEYRALHESSAGDSDFAGRSLMVERDSLDNLINRAVREALIEEKKPSALQVTAGDARAAAVGGIVTEAAPYLAPTFAHLVTFLEPQMGALLSAAHAADYPVKQSLDWIVNKVREKGRRFVEAEAASDTSEDER